jgi:hypothetical protein
VCITDREICGLGKQCRHLVTEWSEEAGSANIYCKKEGKPGVISPMLHRLSEVGVDLDTAERIIRCDPKKFEHSLLISRRMGNIGIENNRLIRDPGASLWSRIRGRMWAAAYIIKRKKWDSQKSI